MPAEPLVTTTSRRVPTQARSRRRVEKMLDAAARLVVERGVEALTTRDIAEAAGVPVASLYQYFADKDDVLVALAARDMEEMDEQVSRDVTTLLESGAEVTLASLVRTVMEAFVAVYHRRAAFVVLYLRGRTNVAVHRFGREHNAKIAEALYEQARASGLAAGLTPRMAQLAVEVGDRVFQLAFEHDLHGDPETVEEGIWMVAAYLESRAAS
ncbi:TetR/AcrR family transcriptional regulator [Nocardioides marmotae]|uniref:TetR family transcriptional regulator n=1 Tax=Nocardioides marmotae TaxID=2663857 RepID=A0A6I3JCP2_9ACTN|nr:TetR/AcrR family transcriptional regulator [Nocardioides marmotae]MCR6032266.1 TetR family transcriptional regulator [Gordonia jinghuaiqii]MBC9734841.1 TetR/AcrR family transcriptional regulator [Nocardioides marmotae]MTB85942.1 TetR family transcriptional regulator [Nocardioides marmotae]MTB95914.1 TetR family transcriptional regulator [Nocardioides marmotae]QKE02744.1 TetR/AcrR family transcriptional regulator [Nocardioides marmotae]